MTAEPSPMVSPRPGRTVAVWSTQRPRPTIDLTPEPDLLDRLKRFAPYAAVLTLALVVGAGAATFATAPAMTDGVDEISALDARDMGFARSLDASGAAARQAAVGRDVSTMKAEIARLQRALDRSRANQAALAKSAAGDADVKALKTEIAGLQKTLDETRAASAAKIEALASRVEQPKEDAGKLAELQARLDRIEKAADKPAPALAGAKPADPETTGSIAAAPDAGGRVVRNWTVREVYDGVALLDGRDGVIEVMRGARAPGLGRIRSIERRDRQWVVVTDRGVVLQRP
ncbi:hypothetical protein ACFSCV_00540 [Methylopila henanensis]|uniref:Uncharacterized protein n=1 Tax=Methylopila henanensis TaxID=873516 RepID=A0ABW4K336_9HYPH